jgi:hypothetical protein
MSGPPSRGSTTTSRPPSAQVLAARPFTKLSASYRRYWTGTCVQRCTSASWHAANTASTSSGRHGRKRARGPVSMDCALRSPVGIGPWCLRRSERRTPFHPLR